MTAYGKSTRDIFAVTLDYGKSINSISSFIWSIERRHFTTENHRAIAKWKYSNIDMW